MSLEVMSGVGLAMTGDTLTALDSEARRTLSMSSEWFPAPFGLPTASWALVLASEQTHIEQVGSRVQDQVTLQRGPPGHGGVSFKMLLLCCLHSCRLPSQGLSCCICEMGQQHLVHSGGVETGPGA